MHSLPHGLWRASRWLRVYEWDWEKLPFPAVDPRSNAARATGYPRHFLYHVLHVMAHARGGEGSLVEYNKALHELLDSYREPAALASALEGELGRRYGAAAVAAVLMGLIARGLLVPVAEEEPVDTDVVAAVAAWLYIAIQVHDEFVGALDVVRDHAPKTVLEIGTAGGGTLFGWAQVAHPDAHLISVDLPGGVGGGGYYEHHVPHFRNFCAHGQRLDCILGDSTSPETIGRVRSALDGAPVDFLFIDGDHSYEGASADFANYADLVPEGGIIFFHDLQPPPPDAKQEMGVWRLWREIRGRYRHAEIVQAPGAQLSAGFGVLYV